MTLAETSTTMLNFNNKEYFNEKFSLNKLNVTYSKELVDV